MRSAGESVHGRSQIVAWVVSEHRPNIDVLNPKIVTSMWLCVGAGSNDNFLRHGAPRDVIVALAGFLAHGHAMSLEFRRLSAWKRERAPACLQRGESSRPFRPRPRKRVCVASPYFAVAPWGHPDWHPIGPASTLSWRRHRLAPCDPSGMLVTHPRRVFPRRVAEAAATDQNKITWLPAAPDLGQALRSYAKFPHPPRGVERSFRAAATELEPLRRKPGSAELWQHVIWIGRPMAQFAQLCSDVGLFRPLSATFGQHRLIVGPDWPSLGPNSVELGGHSSSLFRDTAWCIVSDVGALAQRPARRGNSPSPPPPALARSNLLGHVGLQRCHRGSLLVPIQRLNLRSISKTSGGLPEAQRARRHWEDRAGA